MKKILFIIIILLPNICSAQEVIQVVDQAMTNNMQNYKQNMQEQFNETKEKLGEEIALAKAELEKVKELYNRLAEREERKAPAFDKQFQKYKESYDKWIDKIKECISDMEDNDIDTERWELALDQYIYEIINIQRSYLSNAEREEGYKLLADALQRLASDTLKYKLNDFSTKKASK